METKIEIKAPINVNMQRSGVTEVETVVTFKVDDIFNVLENFLRDAEYSVLHAGGRMKPDEWIFLYPEFMGRYIEIIIYNSYHRFTTGRIFDYGSTEIKYRGFTLRPGYEMKFVLYHPEYLLYKYEWMKHEAKIELL